MAQAHGSEVPKGEYPLQGQDGAITPGAPSAAVVFPNQPIPVGGVTRAARGTLLLLERKQWGKK